MMKLKKRVNFSLSSKAIDMFEDLSIFYRLSYVDLVKKMLTDLDEDKELQKKFQEFKKELDERFQSKEYKLPKSNEIKAFELTFDVIKKIDDFKWYFRLRKASTFIRYLVYFFYEQKIKKSNQS